MSLKFDVTPEELATITKIALRARCEVFDSRSERETAMDVALTHANACPLDLDKLLAAPLADFAHDITGIHRHINRLTGQITGGFVPYFAKPKTVQSEFSFTVDPITESDRAERRTPTIHLRIGGGASQE